MGDVRRTEYRVWIIERIVVECCRGGLFRSLVVKNPPDNAGDIRDTDTGLIPGSGRSPEESMGTYSVFLPEESHGQRSLAGYGSQGHKELDMTEAT